MLAILKALYKQHFGDPDYNVCLLGIESTGKSRFAYQVKQTMEPTSGNHNRDYKPTVGMNVTKFKSAKGYLCLWDLGGRRHLRGIWEPYYRDCHGLIFFIDEKVQEGFNCLLNVLFHPDMASIPLLIIATTQEVKDKIEKQLNETEKNEAVKRKIQVQIQLSPQSSTQNRMRIRQMLNWLYDNIQKLHSSLKTY